jgi:hypothetical protein
MHQNWNFYFLSLYDVSGSVALMFLKVFHWQLALEVKQKLQLESYAHTLLKFWQFKKKLGK